MMRRLLDSRTAIIAAFAIQAALIIAAGGAVAPCIGALLLAACSWLSVLRIDSRNVTRMLLLMATCLVLVTIAWMTPSPANTTSFDSTVLKSVASLLVVEAACLLLWRSADRPHELLHWMIAVGVICGFYVHADPTEGVLLPGLAAGFTIVNSWIAFSLLINRKNPADAKQKLNASRHGRLAVWRLSITGGMLLIVCVAVPIAAGYATEGVRGAQRLVNSQLRRTRGGARGQSKQFVHGGTLSSVAAAHLSDPAGVAVRVFSRNRPGYLRGNAFDYFENSRWIRRTKATYFSAGNRAKLLDKLPEGVPETPMQHQLFALQDPAGINRWRTIKVVNDPRRMPLYFTPVDARLIEGWGQTVKFDDNHIVRMGLWTARPYTVHSPVNPPPVLLPEEDRAVLLTPLPNLEPAAQKLAREITQGRFTTATRIQAVVDFFNREFEYSLSGFKPPLGRDPVSYFMLTRQASHCEFFATAAVAILRESGVPCRYVTGYRVTELDEGHTEFWIGRNRNAHAWVEAYNSETGRWVTVEATPGMELEVELDLAARVAADADFNKSTAERATGMLATLLQAMLSGPAGYSTLAFLAVAASGVAWFTTSKRYVMRRFWESEENFVRRQRAVLLERMDHRIRKSGHRRRPGETLHQFATRIATAAPDDQRLQQASGWYREYALYRYSTSATTAPPFPE